MARTALTVQSITHAGLAPAYTAAPALGHSIPGDGGVFLHVRNGHTAPINVTVETGATLMGMAVADQVVAVPNGADRFIGPFPPTLYNQPDSGLVHIDFSVVTAVTVAAFRLG